jgi:hypothetical protein
MIVIAPITTATITTTITTTIIIIIQWFRVSCCLSLSASLLFLNYNNLFYGYLIIPSLAIWYFFYIASLMLIIDTI